MPPNPGSVPKNPKPPTTDTETLPDPAMVVKPPQAEDQDYDPMDMPADVGAGPMAGRIQTVSDVRPGDTSITLPEVTVTPPSETPPKPQDAGSPNSTVLAVGIPILNQQAAARAAGFSWDDIHSELLPKQQTAFDEGYSQDEIARELGYPDPQPMHDYLAITAKTNPKEPTKPGDPLDPAVRDAYAYNLASGLTKGPQDFSDAFHGAGHPAIEGLSAKLPDSQTLIDHSIAVARTADLPDDEPLFLNQIRGNLLNLWAATGVTPDQALAQASVDPQFRDALTNPPSEYVPVEAPARFEGKGFLDPAFGLIDEFSDEATKQAIAHRGELLAERATDKEGISQAAEVALATGGAFATMAGNLKALFAPSAAGIAREAMQTSAIETMGQNARQTAKDSALLEKGRKDINKALPEYEEWLSLDPAARAGAPKPVIAHILENLEGVPGAVPIHPQSPFKPVVDAIGKVYADMKKEIQTRYPGMVSGFLEDYAKHLFADPSKASRLPPNYFPTLTDMINQGAIPLRLDPIENVLHFVSGMRSFLGQAEVLEQGIRDAYVEFSPKGSPHDGWVALKGSGATKPYPFVDPATNELKAGTQRAYAAPGWAGSYNNWVGKGFYENPTLGKIYDGFQHTSNMLTALKLSLSGYHAFNIVQETAVAGLANGIGDLAHGIGTVDMPEVAQGLKQIGMSVPLGPQMVGQYIKGGRLLDQYMGVSNYGPETELMADLYARGGGRGTGRGFFNGQDVGNWFQAYKFGSARQQVANGWRLATREAGQGLAGNLKTGGRIVGMAAKMFGDTMSTFMAPLFNDVIPKIKFAAFSDEMASWLGRNPTASYEATTKMAQKLSQSMDDRFGELVQDNLFWPKTIKQGLNLVTVSVGWEYGSLRAFAGAGKDIASGNLLSPRARWLMSFPVIMGVMGGVYQYAKTGTLPTQTGTPWQDLAFPRTGGTVTYGAGTAKERAILPGYLKDAFAWYTNIANAPDYTQVPPAFLNTATQKFNPMVRLIEGVTTGKNAFPGTVIRAHPEAPAIRDYANWVMEELGPIGIQQAQRHNKGTTITTGENLLGIRPASQAATAPEMAKGFKEYLFGKDQKAAQKYEETQARKREASPPAPIEEPAAPPRPNPPPVEAPPPVSPPAYVPRSAPSSDLNPNYGTGRLAPLPGQKPEEAPEIPAPKPRSHH